MSVQKLPATGATSSDRADALATWRREQKHLGAVCDFPGCDRHAELGARMCDYHELVRIASNGSWVNDRHPDGGHG